MLKFTNFKLGWDMGQILDETKFVQINELFKQFIIEILNFYEEVWGDLKAKNDNLELRRRTGIQQSEHESW